MIVPLTVADITAFLQSVVTAFENYIYMAFCLMMAFAVLLGVKKLLTWGG